jgi:hypothetical protein
VIEGKPRKVDLFKRHLAAAGIAAERRHDRQPVRWHDLRHSCASSLVAGWWGRRWTLEEVKEHLGHSSITITQRYAHLAESALQVAAAGTVGIGGVDVRRLAVDAKSAVKVTRRSQEMEDHDITAQHQGLLTRRSRVRVPFDPPNNSNGLADDAAARRDLRRDLGSAASGAMSGEQRAPAERPLAGLNLADPEGAAALELLCRHVVAGSALWDQLDADVLWLADHAAAPGGGR